MKLKNVIAAMLGTLSLVTVALGTSGAQAAKVAPGEWYVRLILKTDSAAADTELLVDRYNLLGQLNNTAIGVDSRDLPELGQTWAGTYLSVIFYRPDWDTNKDSFNTDFHPIAPDAADEWTFEVRSDDPARDLSLSWKGNHAKFKHMVLVDVEENIAVPAEIDGVKQVYKFRMNGTVRQFSWRLLTRKEYKAFLASGELPPSPVPATQPAASLLASDQATATSRSAAQPASGSERPSSGWLPLGWGGEAGDVPAGLPADPFGD